MTQFGNQSRDKSWLSFIRSLGTQKVSQVASAPEELVDDESPWLRLHEKGNTSFKEASARRADVHGNQNPYQFLESSPSETEKDELRHMEPPEYAQKNDRVRWLYSNESPYGSADQDGTLRQLESQSWRSAFGVRRPKGFVPATAQTNRWKTSTKPPVRTQSVTTSGTLLLQTIFAMIVVAGGYYAKHYSTPVAEKMVRVYESAFAQDYGQTALPRIQSFLRSHDISLPAFLESGALVLHQPVSGTIVSNYAADRPVMVILGKPGAPVLAAGSGTVLAVEKVGGGYSVAIDHGKSGVTWYSGVMNPSVHAKEFVSSGQLIGQLSHGARPELGFALKKGNQYVNPNDYIHFTGSTS